MACIFHAIYNCDDHTSVHRLHGTPEKIAVMEMDVKHTQGERVRLEETMTNLKHEINIRMCLHLHLQSYSPKCSHSDYHLDPIKSP